MATYHTHRCLRETILRALRTKPKYALDDLVNSCSGFTWNQVFCEIDQLSRSGEVRLEKHRVYSYTLTLAPGKSPTSD